MSRDRSKDRPKTAAELMAELQKDPDYLARARFREQQQRANTEAYAKAAGPLLTELDQAGFRVGSIGELRQRETPYHAGVPILLRWLPRVDHPPLKEDIVRTLSVPWAGPSAAPALIAEFKRAGTDDPAGTSLRWAIANALAVVADDSVFEEIVRLVQDTRSGKAREMLALALGNMKDPRAVGVLTDLIGDEEVVGHAAAALGKLRAAEARPHLEELKKHPKVWVRQEAKKALAKIGKSAG
jgi:hypothetical protein